MPLFCVCILMLRVGLRLACILRIGLRLVCILRIRLRLLCILRIRLRLLRVDLRLVDLNNYLVIACRFKISRPK